MSGPRVVITGSGKAASFTIRGEQLGHAIGAVVYRNAIAEVLASADVVVAVKRVSPELAARLRQCGRPVIWDALDFYVQTDAATRAELIDKARRAAKDIGATAIIGATRQMAEDLGSPFSLPHHGWERGRAEIRDRMAVVAYEGAEIYLAEARAWIERVCAARGCRFVCNPPDYLSADVVLAMRAGPFDTYATRNWKSGLKLSNAQVAGIPFIARTECGYVEQAAGAELWAEDERQFADALDILMSPGERRRRAEVMASYAPRLPAVAVAFRRIIEDVAGR